MASTRANVKESEILRVNLNDLLKGRSIPIQNEESWAVEFMVQSSENNFVRVSCHNDLSGLPWALAVYNVNQVGVDGCTQVVTATPPTTGTWSNIPKAIDAIARYCRIRKYVIDDRKRQEEDRQRTETLVNEPVTLTQNFKCVKVTYKLMSAPAVPGWEQIARWEWVSKNGVENNNGS